jgi:hypothetical protein
MYFLKFSNKLNVAKILTTLIKKNMVENDIKLNRPQVCEYEANRCTEPLNTSRGRKEKKDRCARPV